MKLQCSIIQIFRAFRATYFDTKLILRVLYRTNFESENSYATNLCFLLLEECLLCLLEEISTPSNGQNHSFGLEGREGGRRGRRGRSERWEVEIKI